MHELYDKSERLLQEHVESPSNASHMNNLPEKSLRFHTDLIPNALWFLFCNSFPPIHCNARSHLL